MTAQRAKWIVAAIIVFVVMPLGVWLNIAWVRFVISGGSN